MRAGLAAGAGRRARLAAQALSDSHGHSWAARARTIAGLLDARLPAAGAGAAAGVREGWGRAQSRAWVRQSWRWLVHLARARSWVLPPSGVPLRAAEAD